MLRNEAPLVLLVEDEAPQRALLRKYLERRGFRVAESASAAEALSAAESLPEIILLDWRLPDEDGLSLLPKLREKSPLSAIIMLTAFATVERAVEAMRLGAYHYLTKPVNLEELILIIEKALQERRLRMEVEDLRRRLSALSPPEVEGVVAESPAMREVLSLIARVAPTEATVLLVGESGTGKEVLAGLLHRLSPRKDQPFLKINCAAIPEGLLESELFGHERGAFTGADRTKPGLLEEAGEGTVFLDEIGELPLSLQAKLLRVLQDGTFRRVGGTRELRCRARIVAATNRDLARMVREGTFREDLYWRLAVITLRLPPLRERREDILPLAEHFLREFSRKYGKELQGFSREALQRLLSHGYPGNVRELRNILERAVILAEGPLITERDLTFPEEDSTELTRKLWELPLPEAVELLERRRIEEALRLAEGVKTQAAELLGISERALRYKLERYGL
ncbi:sigma-54-dependent Fis family transcriptional regulator [Thermosulfurimonas marina]|uniref:Sigma-54-dependent Fis family transcriptional regulator n=1 Tax=Thermosulfurimonas marina TaxID=2047767 RepID=A0A6H1WSF6_9BACT|nr:sigma-54 dependent transcriptional regulator [Thermosulfurimonas marina]QJA06157.1 sigma-54-dependent Fis family transcriptional regulator [Thermosulfurimonas marina]